MATPLQSSSLGVLQNLTNTRKPPIGPAPLRNQARVGYLLKSLGLPASEGDGSVSQSDMEGAYQQAEAEKTKTAEEEFQHKLAIAKAPAEISAQADRDTAGIPARITGEFGVKAAEARAKGEMDLDTQKREGTRKLLESMGSNNSMNPNGPMNFKPTINASGDVSFTTSQTPALVLRARNQLIDARDKTLTALAEAERMYPGINDESDKVDTQSASQGWGSFITGMGAPKYGSMLDMVKAGNDRLKYTIGVPTPFSKLAQEASFGNIEQMAGQLPGVRGLATITPLFREHQSRWGHEASLATIQRLRHMAGIIDQTINTIDTGGQNAEGQ